MNPEVGAAVARVTEGDLEILGASEKVGAAEGLRDGELVG